MKDVLIQDIMSSELITLSPYDTLATAKTIFDSIKIHHLPVLDHGKLIGILSSTDLERSKLGKALFINHDVEKHNETILDVTLISMVMTEVVESITVSHTINDAYIIFKEKNFRSLPVFNKKKLVGIVTPMDIIDYCLNK